MNENQDFERKTGNGNLVSDIQSQINDSNSEEQDDRSKDQEASDEEDLDETDDDENDEEIDDDDDEDDITAPEGVECEQCGAPAVASHDGLHYCEDCYQTQIVDGYFKD